MTGQVEHAPTPDQCKADADAWGIPRYGVLAPNTAEFQRLAGLVMRDHNVTARMLDARSAEFTECEKTDSNQAGRYAQAIRAYATAQLGRMAHYMQRHNLTAQFYQEDDQGQR
jgi:hypothetical protein